MEKKVFVACGHEKKKSLSVSAVVVCVCVLCTKIFGKRSEKLVFCLLWNFVSNAVISTKLGNRD